MCNLNSTAMEFFLSFLFWIFGSPLNSPNINQHRINPNQQTIQQNQPNSSQTSTESFETKRTNINTRYQQTIIIFEDTHFRPKRN